MNLSISNFVRWHPLFTQYSFWQLPDFLYNEKVLTTIKYIFLISGGVYAFGLWRRWLSVLAFLSGLIFYLTIHTAALVDHQRYLTIPILFLFAVYENFDSLDEEQFFFLVKLSLCLVFVQAGITKLRHLGLDWITQDIASQYQAFLRLAFSPDRFNLASSKFNLFLLRNHEVVRYINYSIPFLEILAPLTLFRKFRYFYIFFIVLQVSIYFGMFISFIQFAGAYAFFVVPDIKALFDKLRKREDKNADCC